MSSSPSPAPVVVVIHPSTAPQVVHIHLHAGASDSAALTTASAATATATATASSSPRTQETKPYTPPRPAYSPPHAHVLRDNQPAPRMPSPRPAPPAWRRVMSEPALATQGHFDPFGSDGQSEQQWFTLNVHPHRAPSTTLSHAPTWFGPVGTGPATEHAPNPAAWRSVQKEKGLDLLLSDPGSLRSPGLFPQHESQGAPMTMQPGSPRAQAQSPRPGPTQLQPRSPRGVQMPMPMATMQMHQLHHEQQFAQYQSQARPSSRPRGALRAYVETDTETETHTASASVVTRLIHLTDTETRASSVGPELTSRMFRLSVADTIASVPVSHPENDDTEPEPENESRAAEELGQQTVADLQDAARQLWEQTGHGAQVHDQAQEDADEQEQEQHLPMSMPVQMVFDHQTQQLYPVHGQDLQAQYPAQVQIQNFGHQVQFAAQQPQYPAPIQPPQTLFSAQQAQQAQAQHAQVEQHFAQQLFQYREQQQAQQQVQHQAQEYHAPPQQQFFLPLQQPRQTQTCIPAQLTPTSLDEPVLPRTANPFLTPQQQRAPVRRAQTHPNPASRPSTWHDAFAERPVQAFSLDYVAWVDHENDGARAASPPQSHPASHSSYASEHSHPASQQSYASNVPDLLSHPSTARHAVQSPRRSHGAHPHVYRPPSVAVPPSPNIGAAEPWSWVDNPPQSQVPSVRQIWPPLTVPS